MQSVESITQEIPKEDSLFDVEEQAEIAKSTGGKDELAIPTSTSPISLIQNGISFFTQLINTLQDPQAIQQLAATITEKDEQTGRTWLKLPVENEKTVEKALHLLAGLLNGYGK
jgi:hypothetical protein